MNFNRQHQAVRPDTPDGKSLPLEDHARKRDQLRVQRNVEYNKMLQQKAQGGRPETPELKSLPLGEGFTKQQILRQERNKEYNELVRNQNKKRLNKEKESEDGYLFTNRSNSGQLSQKKRDEQRSEYRDMLQSKKTVRKMAPDTPEVGLVEKMGQYASRRNKLQQERQTEYNILNDHHRRIASSRQNNNSTHLYEASLHGLGQNRTAPRQSHSAETMRKIDGSPANQYSAEEEARFQQWLKERQPRSGWVSPSYDEILNKKRQEERAMRQGGLDPFDIGQLRSSLSEGNLANQELENVKLAALDKEFDYNRRQRAADAPLTFTKPLVDPEIEFNEWLARIRLKYGQAGKNEPTANYQSSLNELSARVANPPRVRNRSLSPGLNVRTSRAVGNPASYGATLEIGNEKTGSASARSKENYRRELEEQIRINDLAKQRTTLETDQGRRFLALEPKRNHTELHGFDGFDHKDPLDQPPINFTDFPAKLSSGRSGFEVVSMEEQKRAHDPRFYKQELERQIEEKKKQKLKEKQEKERYERKLDEDIRNYNPFGRGGGGAPLRDQQGNVIVNRKTGVANSEAPNVDLKQMHQVNQQVLLNPMQAPHPGPSLDGDHGISQARGGGIFGEPQVDQKSAQQKYQDELRHQMDEKKRAMEEERRRQRIEDEKLQKKIEEDNLKMKEEEERERQKEKDRLAEIESQKEEQARAEEEKRQLEKEKRMQEEEEKLQELRREEERKRRERKLQGAAPPPRSPPVPSLRLKEPVQQNPPSPPIPAILHKSNILTDDSDAISLPSSREGSAKNRLASADVLNQLAHMRSQLLVERKRVDRDLGAEVGSRNSRNATTHRNLQDFEQLKARRNSSSRNHVSKLFPNKPKDADSLEMQQRILIEEQQRQLERMKQELRRGSNHSALVLDSESAFLGMSPREGNSPTRGESSMSLLGGQTSMLGEDGLPLWTKIDKKEPNRGHQETQTVPSQSVTMDVGVSVGPSLPTSRNSSARSRRRSAARGRQRGGTDSLNFADPVGSVISLNPESIEEKNARRQQKIKDIESDTISSADPEDILSRYMSRKLSRAPSGITLTDDTWMQAAVSN